MVRKIIKRPSFIFAGSFLLLLAGLSRPVFAQGGQLCSVLNRRWRDWCVYTNGLERPKKVLNNVDNLYHPTVWRQNGRVYLIAGGWENKESQNYHDQIFLFRSNDYLYGREGWQIAASPLIGNHWDSPPAWHSVQPSIFAGPFPPFPDGPGCCPTIYYTWDVQGGFPETNTVINWAFLAPDGTLARATKNNPILTKNSGSVPGKTITAVHNPHIFYDPQTRDFYLYYNEWLDGSYLAVSVARSTWLDQPFVPVAHDVLSGQYSSPMMVESGGRYYLFFTHWTGAGRSQIEMAEGETPTGPFNLDKIRVVLKKPGSADLSGIAGTDTPFVFCNHQLNRWQMYFAASSPSAGGSHQLNQIYTAFLEQQSCGSPPYLVYDVNGDGLVNRSDVFSLFLDYFTGRSDLTGDALVNGIDFVKLAGFVRAESN